MAQQSEEVSQKDLMAELEKANVTVGKDKAAELKENIQKDRGGGNYLGVGVHEVYINSIELTRAGTGTLGMKFTVESEDGTADVTMWLSEAALPYTIENVSRLVVHNTGEEKKADARNFMSNIVSAKDLLKVAKEKLVEGVAYLSIKESKTQTYTNKNGEVKPSLERNLLSWKPKEDAKQAAKKMLDDSEPIALSEIPF